MFQLLSQYSLSPYKNQRGTWIYWYIHLRTIGNSPLELCVCFRSAIHAFGWNSLKHEWTIYKAACQSLWRVYSINANRSSGLTSTQSSQTWSPHHSGTNGSNINCSHSIIWIVIYGLSASRLASWWMTLFSVYWLRRRSSLRHQCPRTRWADFR